MFTPTGLLVKCVNDPLFDARVDSDYTKCQGDLIPIYENSTSSWETLIDDLSNPLGQYSDPIYSLKWSPGLANAC